MNREEVIKMAREAGMSDNELLLKALKALREADDDNWLTDIGYEVIAEIEVRLGLPHEETGLDREKAREK